MTIRDAAALLMMLGVFANTSTSFAAERHHSHDAGVATPSEAGQSAFAAIAEILAILEADPATDWSRVNLTVLRQHLVDMNRLMLEARAEETPLDNGLEIVVTGAGPTLGAIHRMVPAHAMELDGMADWSASAEATPEGAILVVTSEDAAVLSKIRGLGFFGLMASGSHHQKHHLAIAQGEAMHQH